MGRLFTFTLTSDEGVFNDNSSIILVQNEGYDIKLGDVNFASDTVSTGAQRVLLVTSLDNDEGVAGATVSLGDTNVTVTDADSLVSSASGTASTAMTLNGTLASTADDNGLVTTFDASSNGTSAITKDGALAASTTLNSLITIKHASDTDSTYTIVGTDIYGNAQTYVYHLYCQGSVPLHQCQN